MAVSLSRRLVSVDEYHRMIEVGILTEEDRVELIHGDIIHMSPVGKLHAATVDRINKIFNKLMGDQAIVRIQSSISIHSHSEPEPDITLLKPSPDFYASKHPEPGDVLLIVEVADTSWDYDHTVKRPMYAAAGIPELWLVNLNRHEIEVHRTPSVDTYKNISILGPGDEITLSALAATLRIEELLGPSAK